MNGGHRCCCASAARYSELAPFGAMRRLSASQSLLDSDGMLCWLPVSRCTAELLKPASTAVSPLKLLSFCSSLATATK
eukprot:1331427-Prymnesium_polylepis.1